MAETRGGRPISGSSRPTGGDKAVMGKKQYFRRKKMCRFCVDKIDDINYKDVRLLLRRLPKPRHRLHPAQRKHPLPVADLAWFG